MAKYLVTPVMSPGVYRQGVGLFPPGSVIDLPDAASHPKEQPGRDLVPLDEEAAAVLKKAHGDDAKPIPADVQAAIDALKRKEDGPAPLKEALGQMGITEAKAGGKRAADR
jgi:hypothetical protein